MSRLHPCLRALGILAVVVMSVLVAPLPAQAASAVESYIVEASIAADGTLAVRATITPDAGAGEIVQRFATTAETTGGRSYRFTLSQVRATREGADLGAAVTREGDYVVVTMPVTDDTPIVLDYTVSGAALATADSTTVSWRLLQGLNLPVETFEASVSAPATFSMIDCAAGPPSAPGACSWYAGGTHEDPVPTFHDGPRGAGEVVQVVLRFPAGSVAVNEDIVEHWTLDRALSLDPLPLAVAAGVAALGLVALIVVRRRYLADADGQAAPLVVGSFRPTGVGHAEFQTSEGIRPGLVGTLADTHVDPVDVTATLLDLAVHGHLLIRELPRASAFAPTRWEFERREGGRPLLGYEATLLDAIAPAGEVASGAALVERVRRVLPAVQAQMYDEVVARGWFARRPDDRRSALSRLGWGLLGGAAAVAALLIAFTTFGVAGLVLVGLAAGFAWVAQEAPERTASGRGVLAGLGLLRGTLLTQPVEEMPPGREVEELSEVLPYAVVLGGAERWLDGLAATDDDDTPDETELPWYHGPQGWHLAYLPDSLRTFITSVEGALLQR